jgi:hypothetical protein
MTSNMTSKSRTVRALPRAVRFLPVPGCPDHVIGEDRSVWRRTRSGLPPPWDRPVWHSLSVRETKGVRCVLLCQGGREMVRGVEQLWRFASDPNPERWAARVLRRFSRASGRLPAAASVPAIAPPVPVPPPTALPLEAVPSRLEPCQLELAPTVVFRELVEWPGYRIGSDRSVWSRWAQTRNGRRLTDPPVWKPIRLQTPSDRRPVYELKRDRRRFFRTPDRLYREAFPPPPPPAPLPLSGICGGARGEASGRARLTDGQVVEARRLRREGWTFVALAGRFRVAETTVSAAVRGLTWRHLDDV